MRILLINPPFNRLKGLKTTYFPLGLGYLAAVLRENGFEASIYNAENSRERLPSASSLRLLENHHKYIQALNAESHYVWQEIKDTLSLFKPDIVGISVMTAKYGSAIKISNLCKEFNPNIKIIWGGPHPTIQADAVLQNDCVDFVIRGEGELSMVSLCLALNNNSNTFDQIEGLSYKNDGEPVHMPARKLITNLDDLPQPAKDFSLYPELYSPTNMGDIVTSRGCPFECAFCGAQNTWGRKVRFRSVEKVINEIIDIYEKYNTREFWFWDDTFTVNRKRTIELCQKLIDKKLNMSWGCTTRVNMVDDELLGIMKKSGCNTIEFGIESGSERILNLIKKNITLEQIMEAVRLARKHKLDCKTFFMVGFPEETKEDIEQTKHLIKTLNHRGVEFSIFTPYPGCELYNRTVELGLLPQNLDWSQFSHQSPENHFMKYITKEDFREIIDEMTEFIERYNFSLRNAYHYFRSNSSYYINNPRAFIRKTLPYLKRKLGIDQ